MSNRTLLPLALLIATGFARLSATLFATDWPQWGGPRRDHVSDEKGLLQDWPADGPRRVWVNENAGLGYSGEAIVGSQLFTIGARDHAERLLAINVADGKERWAAEIGDVLK